MKSIRIFSLLTVIMLTAPDKTFSVGEFGSASIHSASECYTQDGYVAAISEKYLDQVIRFSIDKDTKAIQKLIDAGFAVMMRKGVKVFLVETHVFAGKVEFRLPGSTDVFWTVSEAIKC